MRIAESKIEEIIQRTDIVSLISEYVALKQRGRNYQGNCPFHTETKPSFSVSQDKNIWHCFGCGAGGNSVHFLMKIENLSFVEAVKELAQRAGIPLDFKDKEKDGEFDRFTKILEEAADFYNKNLLEAPEGKSALNYLNKRKVNAETIKKFKIGFSSFISNKLCEYFKKLGLSVSDASMAGLIRKDARGAHADYFRGRITFPIFNYKGRVIGFGGRVLDDTHPKFLNSPETGVFVKRKNLYLLNFAKNEIGKKNYSIVVEGYFDAVMMHQFGFANTVASLGTALTREQAGVLSRYSKNIVLAMDPDEAGQKAADRAIEIFEEEGLNVKILPLPKGFDPDLFLRERGAAELKKQIARSVSIIDFRMRLCAQKYNLAAPEGKVDFVREIIPSVKNIKDPLRRDECVKKLATTLGVREEIVRSYFKSSQEAGRGRDLKFFTPAILSLEEKLLKAVFLNLEYIGKIKQGLENNFEELRFKEVFELAAGDKFKDANELIELINIKTKDENILSRVTALVLQEEAEPLTEDFVEGIIKKIKDERLKKTLKELEEEVSALIEKGEMGKDPDKFNKYQELVKYFKSGKTQ